jgi:uncharacterized protein involved in response to NO
MPGIFRPSHPLWSVGFRPFFSLACLAGAVLPLLWAMIFIGQIDPPRPGRLSTLQWHAHEMFFGFGWAVLGGFLLTATKNWVQVRGHHGGRLMFLAAAWCCERAALWFSGVLPGWLFVLAANAFVLAIVALLAWTLVRHRAQDSYRDNAFFLVVLPAFLLAKNLLLDPAHFADGWLMTLALFRVAFLVMIERTLRPFMRAAYSIDLWQAPRLDMAIKLLGLTLVAAPWLPKPVGAGLAFALAALLMTRFVRWHPLQGMRKIEVGVMFLGYLAIVVQLLLDALSTVVSLDWVGSVSVHVFSFGAIGLIVPAMLTRISKGHTGRPVSFEPPERWVLRLMLLGFALRLLAPQAWPGFYTTWIVLAAACWFGCFSVLGWRLIPLLAQPRVDGREH